MSFSPRIVLVTASAPDEARKLAEAILEKHLAACVSIIPGVESRYWWKGRLETATELQLIIKTSAEQFERVAEVVRWHHSYECPEIISVAVTEVSPEYRAWWESTVQA
jgi:periplasmic divalent cation tolerance protein